VTAPMALAAARPGGRRFLWVAATLWFYFLGQVAVRTDLAVAALLTLAIAFGLLSILAAGGLQSAWGLLNAVLLTKFLLLAVLLKIVLRQPADTNLRAPVTTSWVMVLGFLGLWGATVLFRHLPRPKLPLLAGDAPPGTYPMFSLVLVVFCLGGYCLEARADSVAWGLQTGGVLGVARSLAAFRAFVLVPVMFQVWRSGSRWFLLHPLTVVVLLSELGLGLFSTGKLEIMEPLMYFCLVAVLRLGWRDKRIWTMGAAIVLLYGLLVYPYSQYIRDYGGREGGASSRLAAVKGTVAGMLADTNFRAVISSYSEPLTDRYWGVSGLAPFARFAMIGEGDRLIAATEQTQSYTGWETITWELKMLVPRVLYPQKPVVGPGAYLAHIAGDSPPEDDTTQWAYGPFAIFYSAFGLVGVGLGSVIGFAAYYAWSALFFGNPRPVAAPVPAALWFVCIFGLNQHTLAESGVTGSLWRCPLLMAAMYLFARKAAQWFPKASR